MANSKKNSTEINPFFYIGGITSSSYFINRENLLERITSTIFNSSPQCISIIGQRKIGKTSLLNVFRSEETISRFRTDDSDWKMIHFDCQKHHQKFSNGSSLFQLIVDYLCNVFPKSQNCSNGQTTNSTQEISQLVEIIERIIVEQKSLGFRIVLIFDEFEKALTYEKLFYEGVFGILRALAQEFDTFSWVTSTSRPLHNLFEEAFESHSIPHQIRVSESDFFNIAPPYVLKLFELEDIKKLISTYLKNTSINFNDNEIDQIINIGGFFPYFVQRACFHVFEYKKNKLKVLTRMLLQQEE